MAKLLLKNGRVIDPAAGLDGRMDIMVEDAKISRIDSEINDTKAKAIDCAGFIVAPGFIDMHVHLREPGREDEETIASGTKAAAAGGFTAIAVMPNTEPPSDCRSTIEFILARADDQASVRVFPIGSITVGRKGTQLAEMSDMAAAGAVAFSDDGDCLMDSMLMRRAMEYSRMLDKPVIVHAEDKNLSACGQMNEGFYSTILGVPGMPAAAETAIIARDLALAGLTKSRIHFAHISSKDSIRIIKDAKDRGLNITCEVTPHHLVLTEERLTDYDTNCKMNPPLRSEIDREALADALSMGVIDAVASDHAPHARHEKELEFCLAPFGIIGLETAIPLLLSELVIPGYLPMTRFIEALSRKPATILGLDGLGSLAVGTYADITVLDMDRKHRLHIDSNENPRFFSKSMNTPFAGREVTGAVAMTIVGGKIAYQSEKVAVN